MYWDNKNDQTNEWLRKNDPLFYNTKERKKTGMYYLTNRQFRNIYKRELLVGDINIDYMNGLNYNLEKLRY